MTSINPQCFHCKRLQPVTTPGQFTCSAFPLGIPDPVLFNEQDHTQPVDGDHGIRFLEAGEFVLKDATK